ncbi:MAG: Tex family protein [Anaerovibrio sp.]|nr:RNA-binding transcriptional accessory protein [Selenomonadaceae bacterium]MDY6053770.1 Tex family protein [Anaerovibrio sp.]
MLLENISGVIAKELKIKKSQSDAAIKLIDEGNTIPFIARYRKEVTGALEDEQLRNLNERLLYLRNFVKRQGEILNKIEEQGKLTDELKAAIEKTSTLQELEDIYLPYKQKKSTRAQKAKERGLEPLANIILLQDITTGSPEDIAKEYINPDADVPDSDTALAGAMDILAEQFSENSDLRQKLRKFLWNNGILSTSLDEEKGKTEAGQIFLMYADYREPVSTLPSHRILAINRGEKLDFLKVKLNLDEDRALKYLSDVYLRKESVFTELLNSAFADSWKRLIFPSLERELRAELTATAEKQAINIFGTNLRQLLLQSPLAGYTVMGLDPGYRTGCKMAVVDATGHVLDHGVLYITHGEKGAAESAKKALALIKKYNVGLISIGNGTASFETEEFAAKLIKDNNLQVNYLITNEAGASVYSASALAKEELPEYDVTIRGAVSIARRVQDPLAELVKIDPKAIGVGQYQHDVNQKQLSETLDQTIEAVVNHVGVELNTASPALLKHIAGINATVAKNIIAYRNDNGPFKSRKELLKVARLGNAAFTQCAGFLRINGGKSPLDNTSVHPESYGLAEQILDRMGFDASALTDKEANELLKAKLQLVDAEKLAAELKAGVPTVQDIIQALCKPGRDPREELPKPLTRKAIVKLSDIKVGTIMTGTVRNITDFGAFVDIGIKTAGLIHISELSHKHVKHPLDVVSVGDIISVMVISVDEARGRIGLSLKQAQQAS